LIKIRLVTNLPRILALASLALAVVVPLNYGVCAGAGSAGACKM
jgi:hypothetical protein